MVLNLRKKYARRLLVCDVLGIIGPKPIKVAIHQMAVGAGRSHDPMNELYSSSDPDCTCQERIDVWLIELFETMVKILSAAS